MLSFIPIWLAVAGISLAGSCQYTLELTWEKGAPDGFERDMIYINGQFPGPLIEATHGDWVEIEVINNLPFNTSVHYHGKKHRTSCFAKLLSNSTLGIHQTNTPWADGVPGLTQRPIQPGASYTYKWYADQYGSYFYHAHSRGQIDDGAYGSIIIKPQPGIQKPFHLIAPEDVDLLEEAEANVAPMMLSDWRHRTSEQTWRDTVASGLEAICMDSLLLNGKGAVDCWSREEINAFTGPGIKPILQQANLTLTNKG